MLRKNEQSDNEYIEINIILKNPLNKLSDTVDMADRQKVIWKFHQKISFKI